MASKPKRRWNGAASEGWDVGVRGALALLFASVLVTLPLFPTLSLGRTSPRGEGDLISWEIRLVTLPEHLRYEHTWQQYRRGAAIALDVLHPALVLGLSATLSALARRSLSGTGRRLRATSERLARRASGVAGTLALFLCLAWVAAKTGHLRVPPAILLLGLGGSGLLPLLLGARRDRALPALRRARRILLTASLALLLFVALVIVLGRIEAAPLPRHSRSWALCAALFAIARWGFRQRNPSPQSAR